MNKSESIKELATALAKAQAEIEGAKKDKTNPAFRSKYADLGAVWDACREALTKHGLSVAQFPGEAEPGRVALETTLMHASGEWISERCSIPVTKQDAQGFGSALTYLRRYALAAAVGIAPEDDDGNGAVGHAPKDIGRAVAQSAPKAEAITAPQLADLKALLDECGVSAAAVCERAHVDNLADLPAEVFGKVCAWIEKQRQKEAA